MNRRVNVGLSNIVLQTNRRSECLIHSRWESVAFLSLLYLYRSCEVIDWVSEADQIYHITCPVVNGDKPKDLVVLVSRRKPLEDG